MSSLSLCSGRVNQIGLFPLRSRLIILCACSCLSYPRTWVARIACAIAGQLSQQHRYFPSQLGLPALGFPVTSSALPSQRVLVFL